MSGGSGIEVREGAASVVADGAGVTAELVDSLLKRIEDLEKTVESMKEENRILRSSGPQPGVVPEDNLQKIIEELNRESLKVGLKMNMKNSKVMFNNQLAEQQIMIVIETLESVEEYIYLGQAVSANTAQDREIKRRIGMGCDKIHPILWANW